MSVQFLQQIKTSFANTRLLSEIRSRGELEFDQILVENPWKKHGSTCWRKPTVRQLTSSPPSANTTWFAQSYQAGDDSWLKDNSDVLLYLLDSFFVSL